MWLRWVVSNLLSQIAEDKMRQAVEQAKGVVKPALRRQSPSAGPSAESGPELSGPTDWVVLFALGLESGGLVDRMSNVVTSRCATFVERAGQWEGRRLVVCETGVGCAAAAQASDDIIKDLRPKWVVSAGFAAALTDTLRRGHLVMADSIVNPEHQVLDVGFRMDPSAIQTNPSLHVGRLLTIDRLVRHRSEKEQLAAEYDAIACDMETVAVAESCQRHQVRFLSVRIITDQLDDKLPVEVENMLGQQTLSGKLGAVTGALFRRPGSVKDMWKLQETAVRASDRLAKFLVAVLPQLES